MPDEIAQIRRAKPEERRNHGSDQARQQHALKIRQPPAERHNKEWHDDQIGATGDDEREVAEEKCRQNKEYDSALCVPAPILKCGADSAKAQSRNSSLWMM